jgi:hypothetical protein
VFQTGRIEAGKNEVVDFVVGPRLVGDRRQFGFDWRDEGPVFLVGRALLDPAAEYFFLFGLELVMRVGRRHHFRFVIARDAAPQLALFRVAGDDRDGVVVEFGVGGRRLVEPQVGLAGLGVEAVAFEAVFREDGADVAVEGELFIAGGCRGSGEKGGEQRQDTNALHDGAANRESRPRWRVLIILSKRLSSLLPC